MTAIKEWPTQRKKEYLGYAVMFLFYILVALFAPQLAEGENYGIWTLVPPISIFAFILLTKKIPPVRLDFSANSPCLFGKGIIMPFGKVTCS